MSLLDGLKVVIVADRLTDLGGRMLAEMGADVVLLSERQETTDARRAAWLHGMRRPAEGETAEGLVAAADILLDGRRRGAEPGLDDAAAQNPRLIHVIAHPGIGTDDTPATDLTLMARSGLMTVIGDPDRPPLRLPGEQGYALTGIQVATAALLGLAARRRTGQGQRIDVSAVQSATLANYREAVMYAWTGRVGRRTGNRLVRGSSGVRQVWPCADGYVTWSMIDNPNMMRSLVRVMEAEGAAGELSDIVWEDILVADTDQAVIDRWQEVFGAFFASHDKATLADWSLRHGWGLSAIATLDEVRGSPHLADRGLWVEVDDHGTTRPLPGPLFRFDRAEAAPLRKVP
ncbi:CoA transferase [Wenxinia marina]|uniref:Putative acyl-CoA transferase/carnitine dehydratase n=1 Tax=Wenxinia marina DSM 24838 TaxID=1123501 RepID=A0A0D0PEI8_9RHOB|nr:CoA transferase [Wenxinia marina]KIQ69821.1 putative acyl-CoA transferase/carnitine dehydratase [Wenxinia marina DSM 24838]GGL61514.1 CoA transferase [Wenxinia marina]